MDGTFYMGDDIIDGALDFIHVCRKRGKRFLFLTNNSSQSPENYIKKLDKMGCTISREQIVTSGDVAIRFLNSEYPGASVFLMGTPPLEADMREAGIRLTEDKADIVVAAFDKTLTYEKLEKGCTLIREGAVFLATHPDINCPTPSGFIPDCGAICAAMTLSTGVKPRYLGKPYKETAQMILDKTKVPTERTAFVGDRLYTDVATGVNHGGKGFLVLTGEASLEDAARSETRPDAVFESLGEIARYLS
ncbi:MAG: HAD-IIA family hydrolase [Eubacteriales bacterium]|nr:HAD-IIA family hydrolase [Eubacteriales bacterium]